MGETDSPVGFSPVGYSLVPLGVIPQSCIGRGACIRVCEVPTPAATQLPMAVRPARLVSIAEASVSVYQLHIFIFSKYLVQTNWPSIV